MPDLSDRDIEKIAESLAPKIITQVKAGHHDFWVDPETHYQDHLAIQQWSKNYNTAQKIFWAAFIGLVVIGTFFIAAVGILPKLFGKGP